MKIDTLSKTFVAAIFLVVTVPSAAGETDNQIKDKIIQQAISSYSGSCPCPDNTDRAGRRCGGRSAYLKKGGASPLCYRGDVTDKMVREYRARYGK